MSWALTAMVAALAQEALRLPEVSTAAPAAYALTDLDGASQVEVLLEVLVDERGRVARVAVLRAPSERLGEAAAAAMRDFVFTPGLDARGAPTPVAIQYLFTFDAVAVPSVSATGVLLEAGARRPVPSARVTLRGPGGQTRSATTDALGAFAFVGLEQGRWEATASAAGFEVEAAELVARDRAVSELTLFAWPSRPWEAADVEVVEVFSRRALPEVVERPLRADEIRILPGSGGDVVRAVQNLPGVGRAPLGLGQLIIRGAAPEDSRYSLDGMDIPLVFHFSGLTTVLASDLLDEVAFLPGNFGVRFGRNSGGRVDLRTRSELPARTRGYLSVDLFQAAGLVEVRASPRTAVTLAARRSYVDAVLSPLLSSGDQVFRAPRYYDGQLRVRHTWGSGQSVDLAVLASDDRFVAGSEDGDGEVTPSIGLSTSFVKTRLRLDNDLGGGWHHEASALFGPDLQRFALSGTDEAAETRWSFDLRDELVWERDGGDRLRAGLDIASGSVSFLYDVPRFGPREEGAAWVFAPALYVEPTWVRGPATLVAGLRADLFSYGGRYTSWSVDPRLSARVKVGGSTALSAAVGRFTQLPVPRQAIEAGDGTPGLAPSWALQSSLGLVQRLPRDLSLEVNVYVNGLFDLVVGREERFRFFTGPPPVGPFDTNPYANEGSGLTYGAEVLLKWQSRRGVAWLSGTFGRSLRQGRDDERASAFAYDQRFVVNALASWLLDRQWRVGGRVRVSDGFPYTPIVQRIYALDQRGYIPVYGEEGGARLPVFFALDLRVDKTWTWRRSSFTFFLDVQNVTNQRNVEVIGWSWDFAREEGISSLPVLPVFGLRVDL